MKQLKVKNISGLVPALDFEGVKYEVVQDGFSVIIYYHDAEDLYHIAFRMGTLIERAVAY